MKFLEKIKNSFDWVSGDIAIDLGTANTLIWLAGRGIIINEPSIIAKSTKTNEVIAVGNEAKEMLGKTHQGIETIRPLRDGVIADYNAVDSMLQGFIRKVNLNRLTRPKMVICVPSGVTEVERRAVKDSGEKQAAREVFLVDEPVAAAIGIGLDISKPVGNIIVDIGGGTTEIAVLSLGGVVYANSLRVAGDAMDAGIISYMRKQFNLLVGEASAEKIKKEIGTALSTSSNTYLMKGRDIRSGTPKEIALKEEDTAEALKPVLTQIVGGIKDALEKTPPELSADLVDMGLVLTGGGLSLIHI